MAAGLAAVPAGAVVDERPERGPIAIAPHGQAYDINERGVVVGYHYVDQEQRAFRWQRGEFVDLGPGAAYGVNDAGTVVGRSGGQAVAWNPDGAIVELAPGSSLSSAATDVDRHGTVVGDVVLADGTSHAFVRSPRATEPTLLPVPPGHEGNPVSAVALNDRGTIVGVLQVVTGEPSSLGLVWQGPDHEVAILPGTDDSTYLGDINNRGVIVGATAGGSTIRALRWSDPARPPQEIGTPGTDSIARGVNDRGHVVGVQYGVGDAFHWDPRTRRTTILPGLGSGHADAWAVNDRGVAVGWSNSADPPFDHATVFARP